MSDSSRLRLHPGATDEERLRHRGWTCVDRVSYVDGDCWEWNGILTRDGYGAIRAHGRMRLAHRLAYTVWSGPIPDDLCVLHKCDNRRCINPDHLFLGTRLDNTADMLSKGRGKNQKPGKVHTTCTVEGCENPYRCAGYCKMHYSRLLVHGQPGRAGRRHQPRDGACIVGGCEKPMRSRRLCNAHYQRWLHDRAAGDADAFRMP